MRIEDMIQSLLNEGEIKQEDIDRAMQEQRERLENPTFDYTGTLEEAKSEKIRELTYMCKQDIMYGFIASNGNSYRLEIEDQLNMQGQKAELDDDTSITTVNWMTKTDVAVTHSRSEWLQVYKEAFDHKRACIFKNKSLRDQVKSATTIDEVTAITW